LSPARLRRLQRTGPYNGVQRTMQNCTKSKSKNTLPDIPGQCGRFQIPARGRLEPPHRNGEYPAQEVVGLAFSGGGIRSATFGLGVLRRGYMELDLLRSVDYLSTVSGGGLHRILAGGERDAHASLAGAANELGGRDRSSPQIL